MKGFNFKKNRTEKTEDNRYAYKDALPGVYPFWTNNCADTGMVSITFDPTVPNVTQYVDVDVSDFEQTPLVVAWMRPGNTDLSYSSSSVIYKFPCVLYDDAGVQLAAWNMHWGYENEVLRFARQDITTYGSAGDQIMYIKYFLFNDDTSINIDTRIHSGD